MYPRTMQSVLYAFIIFLCITMFNIQLCTWNATGLMSSAYYLSCLLNNETVDIVGLSEHWLRDENISFLKKKQGRFVEFFLKTKKKADGKQNSFCVYSAISKFGIRYE